MRESKKYQAYYTKSTPIVEYMVDKIDLQNDDKIFEPCGGDGVFVEEILDRNEFAHIDIFELNENSINILNEKFNSFLNVNIQHCDTLLNEDLILNSTFGGLYDKIIANPPYGAWQDSSKKQILKKIFPDLYIKETYTLFLYRCIELLKDGGILSFIIPDTFLNLHMHMEIRRHILTKTKIVELALFPSSFFPGINFGYANLSIITLKKCSKSTECLNNEFNTLTGFTNVEQLTNLTGIKKLRINQKDIYNNSDFAFLIANDTKIIDAINTSNKTIGDIADCVTGFYSGNDKKYLHVKSHNIKNGKNYTVVDNDNINSSYKNYTDILNGINSNKHLIPIVKGGNTKYLKPDCWYMDWSQESVNHYKKDKKSRFQNPQFYFKFGIGVPMISSSNISACLIENKLFDQSIVGIFPKEEKMVYYLLAFFNSPTCNKLIRTINPSANNPANYIKKIPFIIPNESDLKKITSLTKAILFSIEKNSIFDENIEKEIHQHFKNIFGF